MTKANDRFAHSRAFLDAAQSLIGAVDVAEVERLVELLVSVREGGGRVFVLGVGGSAANASHAVNDLRKLCNIEAYAPTDNVSELTARINDDGWEGSLAAWLRVSRLAARDMLLVFSVGGGDVERGVSVNLVRAIDEAKRVGGRVGGVVGRELGYTARVGDAVVVMRGARAGLLTPLVESMQALVLHLLVSHPSLQQNDTKWGALEEPSSSVNAAGFR